MLKKGYLAGTVFYASIAHTPGIMDGYFNELDKIFAVIRDCEEGKDVHALLEGPVSHEGFRRLN